MKGVMPSLTCWLLKAIGTNDLQADHTHIIILLMLACIHNMDH